MTDFLRTLGLLALLLIFAGSARAQPHVGGFLTLDKRFAIGTRDVAIEDFYNRLRTELTAPLGDRVFVRASLDARFYDLPRPKTFEDLEDPEEVFPMDLTLWEAYVDVYGFLFGGLDVRLGKQRIAWGRADRLNPTDNLNPDDFSDLTDFGEKLPTWALKGTYYAGAFQLTGVWLPSMTPVLLPRGGTELFLGPEATGAATVLDVPDAEPAASMAAFRAQSRLGAWDYSLSYFTGYDDVPVLRRVTLPAAPETAPLLTFGFPRVQVVGADVATEVRGIGLWGEAGVFFPEEVTTRTTTATGAAMAREVALDDDPYVRFTTGGDYTWPGGLYVNAQWVHGFFAERGPGQLHDYLFAYAERDVLREALRLRLGGALEVAAWDDALGTVGYGLFPEVTYQEIDNLEMTAGAFVVGGEAGALLGTWDAVDQFFLKAQVWF